MMHNEKGMISDHGLRRVAGRIFDKHQWRFLLLIAVVAAVGTSCEKEADPASKPQPPAPVQFVNEWNSGGDGPGKLSAPVAFTVDLLGNVFFADPASGFVDKFQPNGTPLLSFRDYRLRHASGITVDSGGAIYVAEADRGEILIFFPDGRFLRAVRIPRQHRQADPLAISVDANGSLYVPDPERGRVLKLDPHGRVLNFWEPRQDSARGEAGPSAVAAAPDGSILVAFAKTGRIERLNPDGSLLAKWDALPNAHGDDPITGLAASDRFVFAASAASPHLHIWTLDGQHWLDSDAGGRLEGVRAPQIALTPDGELLVFDPPEPRVFRLRIHP
jgi:hypothetical protein